MRRVASSPGMVAVALVTAACADGPGARLASVHVAEWALRPDNPASTELFRFDAGDDVEAYDSPGGAFRLHFARVGANAVPAADLDGNGTPDFIQQAATSYDAARLHYRDVLGFREPMSDANLGDNGGDGRFDVYFVDFAGSADGAFQLDACANDASDRCIGYMVQENDFAGYGYPSTATANRILASHEYFHAVQAAYDVDQGSVLGEGTAVWATESFDAALDDFEGMVAGYFRDPGRSLDKPSAGPVDPFSYGTAIFWRYLTEREGDEVLRELWEAVDSGANPSWPAVLPAVLEAHGWSFHEAFADFAVWNLYTGSHADSSIAYAHGDEYPSLVFENVTLPFVDVGPRFYHAATTYYRSVVGARSQVTAALLGARTDLRVALAVERAGRWSSVTWLDELEGRDAVEVTGADRVITLVVNTALDGDSRRPVVCLGSPSEVEACRAAHGDGSSDSDAGTNEGGCAALPATPASLAWLGVGVFARRRRRQGRSV